ncbi:MAG: diadenylate cyclase CdaA [Anaerolineales bacterium]
MTDELLRFMQELDLLSIVDILLVATIFFVLLLALRGTQAINLLRGVLLFAIIVFLLSGALRLRAISWLLRNALPALLFAIPVIFQPEIRRALDRLGRASALLSAANRRADVQPIVEAIVTTCESLSEKRFGGLIVIEREVGLQEYIDTGVAMNAYVSSELLVQIFYKDTPLHDGAVILRGRIISAAACVLPLSSQAGLTDRQLGLRHRAALGVTETSDAVAVVVSEETGGISVVQNGRMIRRLDTARLRNILMAFYRPRTTRVSARLRGFFSSLSRET